MYSLYELSSYSVYYMKKLYNGAIGKSMKRIWSGWKILENINFPTAP